MTETIDSQLAADAMRAALEVWTMGPGHVETLEHADGSRTVIVYDDDAASANPRDCDGNVSTLVNMNRRTIDVDSDDAGLYDAWDRFEGPRGDVDMMRRYLRIFRPDILHFDTWTAGDSHGWGYVTAAAWRTAMGEDYSGEVTPAAAFASEVDVYRQWAEGEVYGAAHLTLGAPIVAFGEHGAYVDGYDIDEDTCWGFLGYDSFDDIAAQFTDSPVVGVQ